MPLTEWGWAITPEELRAWTLHEDGRLLAVNKPGLVLCHPSKHGPWSSLVGAAREACGLPRMHMPFRLDRETSGVVVLVKEAALASKMQRAVEHRQVEKTYLAVLEGDLAAAVTVDQPIGKALDSRVVVKRGVVAGGQEARTRFEPVARAGGYTMARVRLYTGRLHQIRVHASWLGHPVAGDKIYGSDETLFLEFIERGFTERLAARLPLRRQALHAWRIAFQVDGVEMRFEAPLTKDLQEFCERVGLEQSCVDGASDEA
jgi:23S rRNA pseudouridine1911/1915/1917 synthase